MSGSRNDAEPGLAEVEARRALDAYPTMVAAGTVFTCLEEVAGRWRIFATELDSPQQARDDLAHHFLVFASKTDDKHVQDEFRAAADLLDREKRDELVVAGRRFRVGRIEKSVRMGVDGPEPPRSTDPDGAPGLRHSVPRRSLGFIHQIGLTGTAAAATRYALRDKVSETESVQTHEDASLALDTHPRLVLLPAEFSVAEEIDGRWRPLVNGTEVTPQGARDSLSFHLRVILSGRNTSDPRYAELAHLLDEGPAPDICEKYTAAADRVDRERPDDVRVVGEHFRIMRVDQIVRVGRDGPEPPRPSDPDPYGPPAA